MRKNVKSRKPLSILALTLLAVCILLFAAERVRKRGASRQPFDIPGQEPFAETLEPGVPRADGLREDDSRIRSSASPAVRETHEAEEDAAGVALDEDSRRRLEHLRNAHGFLVTLTADASFPEVDRARAELSFLGRCVVSILHARGRGELPDAREAELGGFVLRSGSPDEFVIAADQHKYRFRRGEFPAYDLAHDRVEALESDPPAVTSDLPDLEREVQVLYERALVSLGASPAPR